MQGLMQHRKNKSRKTSGLQQTLSKIENRINVLEERLSPILQELAAQDESRHRVIMSCDASLTANPGGQAAYGVLIRHPENNKTPREYSGTTNAKTCNEAELDAIYQALNVYMNIYIYNQDVSIECIEVRSDSQLSINLINHKKGTNSPKLKHKVACIQEISNNIAKLINKEIKYVWRRRNSTVDLKAANYLAQDVIGVKNH